MSGFYPPVKDLIGHRTVEVLTASQRVESYIIQSPDPRRQGFAACKVLAKGPTLSAGQVSRLRQWILAPESHYNGHPVFRRLPSVPNFAFRFVSGNGVLDVLVDLHNPGWEFYCGEDQYRRWHWVGDEMVALAKELFPQFASPNRGSVWKKGTIEALKASRADG